MTVGIHGLTAPPLARRLGLVQPPEASEGEAGLDPAAVLPEGVQQ